tara:strand:+ start:3087 stop:3365 length:279 start_codon:yes stop_codon:yes gene_type:complete
MSVEYWTTRDGENISVDDMDITHLRNTLKLIIRIRNGNKTKVEKAYDYMQKKIFISGVNVTNFPQRAIDDLLDELYPEDPADDPSDWIHLEQ